MRPLLFLDVDGPLNPFQAKPSRRPAGYLTFRIRTAVPSDPGRRKPLRVWLKPEHGPELLALPYDLVWATTWMDEANQWIAPEIGLPELPVISWSDPRRGSDGLHWKTRELVEYAAGRPFAWVDDELTDADRAWVAAQHGEALLHWVDPRLGLLGPDFETLRAWAGNLSE